MSINDGRTSIAQDESQKPIFDEGEMANFIGLF